MVLALVMGLLGCAALDGTPPTIQLSLPTEQVAGSLQIHPEVHDEAPGIAVVELRVDGDVLPKTGDEWLLDTTTLPDGEHQIAVIAIDGALSANSTTLELEISTDNSGPKLALAPTSSKQGQTLVLCLTADEPLTDPVAHWGERQIPLYPSGAGWRGLLGMDLREVVGERPIELTASDMLGNPGSLKTVIAIGEGEFTEGGYIRLSKAQTAARKDEEAKAKTRAERDAAYAHDEPRQLWKQPFIKPIQARITSPYGKYRKYSDGQRSYHSGMDLAHRRRKPIVASADGEVLVAGWQAIFGNVVIVHHGQGVTTSYNHLDELSVEVGDEVAQGDLVGLLGSTGQSTGPHLHWGLTVSETAVDPAQWIDPVFWESLCP